MKITSSMPRPGGGRQVTVTLDEGEDLAAIVADGFYRLAEQVMPGHAILGRARVYWDVTAQMWRDE